MSYLISSVRTAKQSQRAGAVQFGIAGGGRRIRLNFMPAM